MTFEAGSGHPGGSLSCVEIMAVLYFQTMKHWPQEPLWDERDRFILSKGHVCPTLYAILSLCGYFPESELTSLRKFGSRLQGHPSTSSKLPGIEVSSGSLGQGLAVANGIALAAKMDRRQINCFCLMGDGEIQEGSVWEAAMFAAHHQIDNICAIVDLNGLQIDGATKNIMNIEPLAQKWSSFGWHTETIDGHQINELQEAFKRCIEIKGKPSIILAKTIKGKGISFMENQAKWHGLAPSEAEMKLALKELGVG